MSRERPSAAEMLLDSIPDVAVAVDDRWRVTALNAAAARLCGRDALGEPFSAAFPGLDAGVFGPACRRAMRERTPVRVEGREAARGAWWQLDVSPLEGGGLALVVRDVTDRRRTEEALQASEERLRLLGDHLPESAVYQYERDEHGAPRFTHVSAGIERLNGVTADALLRDPGVLFRQVPAEHLGRLFEAEARSARELSDFSIELPTVRPDGATRWMRLKARPCRAPDGRIVWSGVQTDITAQREAELRLAEVRERADFLAWALETSTQPFGVGAPDGRLVLFNRAFVELTGYTEDELRKNTWNTDLTPPEWRESEDRALAELRRTGEPQVYEKEYRRKDGSRVSLEIKVHLTRSADGRTDLYYGFMTDITERNATARALRESRERLQAALTGSGAGSFRWDITTGELQWDENLDRLFGLPPGQTVRSLDGFLAAVHPEDRAGVIAGCRRCAADGADFDMELRVVWPDGTVRWLADKGKTFPGADGRPASMTGVCLDITDRKHIEVELRRAHALLTAVHETLPALLFAKDRHGRLTYVNDGYCRIVGRSHEEVLGRTDVEQFGDGAFARTVTAHDRRVMATGRPETFEELHPDGERTFLVTKSPMRDEAGALVGIVGVGFDVTDRKQAEEQLRRSEALLSAVLDALPVGVIIADARGRIVRDNAANRQLWGIPPETTRWEQYAEWVGYWAETGRRIAADEWAMTRALLHGEEVQGELVECARFGTGERRLYLNNAAPVRDRAGAIVAGVVVELDVTERVRAERRLAEAQARLEAALAAATIGTWTWDIDADRVTADRNLARMFGVSPADAAGGPLAHYLAAIHPDDRPAVAAAVGRALAHGDRYEADYRLVAPDGTIRWVEARGRVLRDLAGRATDLPGIVVDITERKRTEAELRARERELQMLADNSPDILTRVDRRLRHVFVNAAVEAATGLPPRAFLGKTNRELGMPPDVCDLWENALAAVFTSGAPRSLDFDFTTPAGRRHYVARLVPEFADDGRVEFVLGVARDMTDHKRHEETLKEQDRRKDEFLATLAHELRNPLSPLQNGLQLLRLTGHDPAAAARTRDMMERQLGHLVRLVDDLLDISRVSRGKITLRRERMTVQEAIAAALEACRPTLDDRRHALVVDAPDEPLAVDGDRTRLVQVVSNLVTNAAKYSEPGGTITVAAHRDGDEAVVTVTDTGVGIAPALLPTLWDMFTQVRDTLDKAQGGLGIGLSLVKKLAEMHGGSVAADSPGPGRGSTFTVRLPLAPALEGAAPGPSGATDERPPAAGRRVLVVDDNVDGAESLTMILDLFGHRTETAHDGPAALAAARTFRPEVVFLDIGLPGMDGYEVARRLRADPATADAVLVALTGWGSEEDKRRSRSAGFDRHLTKPVEAAVIEAVLAELPAPRRA